MTERRSLSASQIETFSDCPRKWAYKYIAKIKAPPNKSAQLGTRVHTIAEHWHTDALQPDPSEWVDYPNERTGAPMRYYPGRIFLAGIQHNPPPRIAEVERELSLTTPEAEWTGRVDMTYREDESGKPFPIWMARAGGIVVVADHKSTRDFKYVKTPEILRTDPQACLYAAEAMSRYNVDKVHNRWIYYRTGSGDEKSIVSSVVVHRAEIENSIKALDEIARAIYTIRDSGDRAEDVIPNPEACERYGGCPHKSYCPLTETERFQAAMNTADGSPPQTIQDLLKKKRDAAAAQAGALGVAPPIPMQAAPEPTPPPIPVQAPPVVVTAPRPPFWIPGDPMNPAQAYFHAQNKPLSMIASSADNPPPEAVALSYDHPVPVPQAAPAPSVGNVNAPEAPPALSGPVPGVPAHLPPPTPVTAKAAEITDDLTACTREKLKSLCVAFGLCPDNEKGREPKLRGLIRDARARGLAIPVQTGPLAVIVDSAHPQPPPIPTMTAVQAQTHHAQPHVYTVQPAPAVDPYLAGIMERGANLEPPRIPVVTHNTAIANANTIGEALEMLGATLESLKTHPSGRALSLMVTKIEEAIMWGERIGG